MKKIFVDRATCIGLGAYLHRTDLSVVRSFNEPVSLLRRYFYEEAEPSLSSVIAKLASLCASEMTNARPHDTNSLRRGAAGVAKDLAQWYLCGGLAFRGADLVFIHDTLKDLSSALDTMSIVDGDIFPSIRWNIYLASNFMFRRIPFNVQWYLDIYHIQHYNPSHLNSHFRHLQEITNGTDWVRS